MLPSSARPQPSSSASAHKLAETVRAPLAERLLLLTVCAQLIALPWGFGAMRIGAQTTGLVLGLLALLLALLPRRLRAADGTVLRFHPWPRLLRFPLFWLGLGLFALIVTGALNPAWAFITNGKVWWMVPLAHIDWLPASVRVPFERWGPWRSLIIYAAAWSTVCATWVGFTRRRTWRTLFTVLAVNGFALALVGLAQRGLNAREILWFWQPPASYFVSTFTYKNHAGAYFNLIVALCAGLAFWHHERSARRLTRSSPAGLFAFFALVAATLVVFSYSRTATALLALLLVALILLLLGRTFLGDRTSGPGGAVVVAGLVAFGAFAWFTATSLRLDKFFSNLDAISGQIETMNGRIPTAEATWTMAIDRPVLGWGAGAYRFVFPIYQRHFPGSWQDARGKRLYWEHAHNDYLEWFTEYGLVGVALAALGFGYAGWRLLRLRVWQHPLGLCVTLGVGLTLVHGWVDFHSFNAAILATWAVLLFGTLRWLEMEERARGAEPRS